MAEIGSSKLLSIPATRRYLPLQKGPERYGGTLSAWRRWALLGLLGDGVIRAGRLVLIDTVKLDQRLEETGQLLVPRGRVRNP